MIKMLKNNKGITLLALVITIIILIILAGVALAMLSGENGVLTRTTESTFKTEISSIQEALRLKKTEILANNEGTPLTEYNISFDDLQIDSKVKDAYKEKLIIGKDGRLYYDGTKVTDAAERSKLEAEGITEYQDNAGESYTFTLGEFISKGATYSDGFFVLSTSKFWPSDASETLKNSKISKQMNGTTYTTYNITCLGYANMFDLQDTSGASKAFAILQEGDDIKLVLFDENGQNITNSNYSNYANLKFTITAGKQEPPIGESYTFTLGEFISKGATNDDDNMGDLVLSIADFWPEDVSETLKNSTIDREFLGITWTTYNIVCTDASYENAFDNPKEGRSR